MKYKTRRRKPNRRQSLLKQLIFIFLVILGILVYNKIFNNQAQKPSEAQLQEINEHKFIKEIAPLAQKSQKESQVLASITIAQACLESNFGKSELARKYHNLFGVKASGDVPKVSLATQEYENGQWVTVQGVFRVYPNFADSVSAHTPSFSFTEQHGILNNMLQFLVQLIIKLLLKPFKILAMQQTPLMLTNLSI